jgi:hypothetical protein
MTPVNAIASDQAYGTVRRLAIVNGTLLRSRRQQLHARRRDARRKVPGDRGGPARTQLSSCRKRSSSRRGRLARLACQIFNSRGQKRP